MERPAPLRVALLHLAPVAGDLDGNRSAIERGILHAATLGAHLVVTPELATSGYSFADAIGTDWVLPQPDPRAQRLAALAAEYSLALLLGTPDRDDASGTLHNTVLAITPSGDVVGRHRKVNTLRVGAEAWSVPGSVAEVLDLGPVVGRVGVLICADACTPAMADLLREDGAEFLVSAAAWAPGLYGPAGEWETISRRTGLPVFVCNRTGTDPALDFSAAESVVVYGGHRVLSRAFPAPTLLLVEWDWIAGRVLDSTAVPLTLTESNPVRFVPD